MHNARLSKLMEDALKEIAQESMEFQEKINRIQAVFHMASKECINDLDARLKKLEQKEA